MAAHGKGQRSGSNNRRRILDDHKRVGNRLRSPWLTEFDFQFVSYIDEVIPEIILLGLLNEAHGYARGAELSLALSRALLTLGDDCAPLLSTLGNCSVSDFEQIKGQLGDNLVDVKVAAAPLLAVLPEHPLGGLDVAGTKEPQCILLLKDCVARLYDKSSVTACATMANLYYAQACNSKIHIAQGLRVPNLESIISDPDSDNAHHASASVRMHAQMLIGHLHEEESADWPKMFWHRCYLASDCEIEHE